MSVIPTINLSERPSAASDGEMYFVRDQGDNGELHVWSDGLTDGVTTGTAGWFVYNSEPNTSSINTVWTRVNAGSSDYNTGSFVQVASNFNVSTTATLTQGSTTITGGTGNQIAGNIFPGNLIMVGGYFGDPNNITGNAQILRVGSVDGGGNITTTTPFTLPSSSGGFRTKIESVTLTTLTNSGFSTSLPTDTIDFGVDVSSSLFPGDTVRIGIGQSESNVLNDALLVQNSNVITAGAGNTNYYGQGIGGTNIDTGSQILVGGSFENASSISKNAQILTVASVDNGNGNIRTTQPYTLRSSQDDAWQAVNTDPGTTGSQLGRTNVNSVTTQLVVNGGATLTDGSNVIDAGENMEGTLFPGNLIRIGPDPYGQVYMVTQVDSNLITIGEPYDPQNLARDGGIELNYKLGNPEAYTSMPVSYEIDSQPIDGQYFKIVNTYTKTSNNAGDANSIGFTIEESDYNNLDSSEQEDYTANGPTLKFDETKTTARGWAQGYSGYAVADFNNPLDSNGNNAYAIAIKSTETATGYDLGTIDVHIHVLNPDNDAGVMRNLNLEKINLGNEDPGELSMVESVNGSVVTLTTDFTGTTSGISGQATGLVIDKIVQDETTYWESLVDNPTTRPTEGSPEWRAVVPTETWTPIGFVGGSAVGTLFQYEGFSSSVGLLNLHDQIAEGDVNGAVFGLQGHSNFGADNSQFEIIVNSIGQHVLKKKTTADYENPTDNDNNNVYKVYVKAVDAAGFDALKPYELTIGNNQSDDLPTFAGTTTAYTVEGTVQAFVASSHFSAPAGSAGLEYSITGGDVQDNNKFNIDANNGTVNFKVAPDYENPNSYNSTNAYIVTVKAENKTAGQDGVKGWIARTFTVNVTNDTSDDLSAPVWSGRSSAQLQPITGPNDPQNAQVDANGSTVNLASALYIQNAYENSKLAVYLNANDENGPIPFSGYELVEAEDQESSIFEIIDPSVSSYDNPFGAGTFYPAGMQAVVRMKADARIPDFDKRLRVATLEDIMADPADLISYLNQRNNSNRYPSVSAICIRVERPDELAVQFDVSNIERNATSIRNGNFGQFYYISNTNTRFQYILTNDSTIGQYTLRYDSDPTPGTNLIDALASQGWYLRMYHEPTPDLPYLLQSGNEGGQTQKYFQSEPFDIHEEVIGGLNPTNAVINDAILEAYNDNSYQFAVKASNAAGDTYKSFVMNVQNVGGDPTLKGVIWKNHTLTTPHTDLTYAITGTPYSFVYDGANSAPVVGGIAGRANFTIPVYENVSDGATIISGLFTALDFDAGDDIKIDVLPHSGTNHHQYFAYSSADNGSIVLSGYDRSEPFDYEDNSRPNSYNFWVRAKSLVTGGESYLNVTINIADVDGGYATSINGYYPLYTTESLAAEANRSGESGTHTHSFSGVTYYMPNDPAETNGTQYHGNFNPLFSYSNDVQKGNAGTAVTVTSTEAESEEWEAFTNNPTFALSGGTYDGNDITVPSTGQGILAYAMRYDWAGGVTTRTFTQKTAGSLSMADYWEIVPWADSQAFEIVTDASENYVQLKWSDNVKDGGEERLASTYYASAIGSGSSLRYRYMVQLRFTIPYNTTLSPHRDINGFRVAAGSTFDRKFHINVRDTRVAPSFSTSSVSLAALTEGQTRSLNIASYLNSGANPTPTYSIVSDSSVSGDKFTLGGGMLYQGVLDYEVEGSSVTTVVRASNSKGSADFTINTAVSDGDYALEAPYWGAPPNDRDQFTLPSIAENSGNYNISLSSYVSDFGGPNPSFEMGVSPSLNSNSHEFQDDGARGRWQVPGMPDGTYIYVSGTTGSQFWNLVVPDLDYEAISTKIGDGVAQFGETLAFRIPLVIRTQSQGVWRNDNMQFWVMVTNDESDDPMDTSSSSAFETELQAASETMVKTVGSALLENAGARIRVSCELYSEDDTTVVITKNFLAGPSTTEVITGSATYQSIWEHNLNTVEIVGNGTYSIKQSNAFDQVKVTGGGPNFHSMNQFASDVFEQASTLNDSIKPTLDLSEFSGYYITSYEKFCESSRNLKTIKFPNPTLVPGAVPLVTSACTTMHAMFQGCNDLELDQPDWDAYVDSYADLTAAYNNNTYGSGLGVRTKKDFGMHHYAQDGLREGRTLPDAGSTMWNWDTSKVVDMSFAFNQCYKLGANYMSSDSSQFIHGKHINWNNTYAVDYTHTNQKEARAALMNGIFYRSTDSVSLWQGGESVTGFNGAMKILASVATDNGGSNAYNVGGGSERRSPTYVVNGDSDTFNMSTMGFEHWDIRKARTFQSMFADTYTLPRTQIFLISQSWNPNINSLYATSPYGTVGASDVAEGPYDGNGEPLAVEETSNWGSPYRYMFYRSSEQDINSHILPGTLRNPQLNGNVTTSTDGRTGNTANETRPAIYSDRASGVIGHKLVLPGVYGHDDYDESWLFKAGKFNDGSANSGYLDTQGLLIAKSIDAHMFQGNTYGSAQISFSRWAKQDAAGNDVGNYEFARGGYSYQTPSGTDERGSRTLIPPHGYAGYSQNGKGGPFDTYNYSVNGTSVSANLGSTYQPQQGLGYQNPYPTTNSNTAVWS